MPPVVPPTYFQIPITPAILPPPRPHPGPEPKRKPLLRLEVRDLSSAGSAIFLQSVCASSALQDAVSAVLGTLYTSPDQIPPTRSVTLILRSMDGVAYTTGTEIDSDHKEIHFSTEYICGIPAARRREEILGVLTHEMVHCWQYDACGSAPGGLIEGIADFVRLRAEFVPPHWKREAKGEWDGGYQHTGYFLDWLEGEVGQGTVRKLNLGLRGGKYEEGAFWKGVCGMGVARLWKRYRRSLTGGKGGDDCDESDSGDDGDHKDQRDGRSKSDEEEDRETEGQPEEKCEDQHDGGGEEGHGQDPKSAKGNSASEARNADSAEEDLDDEIEKTYADAAKEALADKRGED